ncbi:MAG: alpha/beta fold hydrolase, partial [Actinomycetota bacterium]
MKNRLVALLVAVAALAPAGSRAAPCVETPRRDGANPIFKLQEQRFGFHDEELILCSPGATSAVHIAARLWVPKDCPDAGGCAGVVIAHGFGFNKEVTFADMLQAVQRGMFVLSYDVRGQGMSGGQAAFLGRDDIADQAAILAWWHENVRPTKTAFYGLSQGGYLSWTAAVYNCGSERAAHFDDPTISCDAGKRWIDAIAPMQGPTEYLDDHTCPLFGVEAVVYSRANPALVTALLPCVTGGSPEVPKGIFVDVAHRMDRIDVPVYVVTSFYDRLVLAQMDTRAYEILHARSLDPGDVLFGKDVRLTISNDSHGAAGGNFAVVGDVFTWIASQIAGGPPLRDAKVAIAQEWAGNAFRLEEGWPIPGTTLESLYLARAGAGSLGADPGGVPDRLRNLPVLASPPEAPFVGTIVNTNNDRELPDTRLVYATQPVNETMEVTGQPTATIFVSSASASGTGQLHLGLAELKPNGPAQEFAYARIGLSGLGPEPVAITIPFTVAS